MMRTVCLGALALVTAIAASTPAIAQIAGGRSGSSTMSYFDGQEVWDTLSVFGRCYADQNKNDAFKLLATEPGTRAEAEAYRALFSKSYQSCLGSVIKLNVSHSQVRGAIAEGLYKKHIPVPATLMVSPPASGNIRNLSDAARCFAASDRDRVQRLILETKPGSQQEAEAVVGMMPQFSRCVPKGATNLQFDATLIRFRLAEALLRMPVPAGDR